MRRRIIITLIILATPFIVGLALTFEIINIDFVSFMEHQESIGYREGPRLLPPAGSVPISGVEVPPDGSLPENPIAASEESLARGEVLYRVNCGVCHGDMGRGDGPVAPYFNESPDASEVSDITSPRITREEDGLIYLTITEGFQGMPPIAENLTPQERWDVINYLRTLQGST